MAAEKFRWIMYLQDPLGGQIVIRVHTQLDAMIALISYGETTGFGQALQATTGEYGCTGALYPYTEAAWELAQQYGDKACPFDYPAKLVKNGPRGGVKITEA